MMCGLLSSQTIASDLHASTRKANLSGAWFCFSINWPFLYPHSLRQMPAAADHCLPD